SAIEEALALNDPKSPATTPAASEKPSATATPASTTAPSPDDEIFADRPAAPARAKLQPRSAANDDRQSVGQILASLHQKPSRTPYLIALGLSVVWTVGQLFYARGRYQDELAAISKLSQLFDQPFFIPLVTMIVLPVIGFFLFAALIRRSQEMRYVAGAMTEITMRFAEPEGVSSDAFVSVGQAIRREIAGLNDGIERAIARAAELESMVRSEVSTLERAYDENEVRVRHLVDSLQSERDGIMTHALRLQEAISGVNQSFNFDVDNVSERVTSAINETTNRMIDNFVAQTHAARAHINAAGDEVTETLLNRSHEASKNLAQVGGEIANAVAARGIKTIESLQESTDLMSSSIVAKGDAIRDVLISRLQQLEDAIVLRGSEVADRVMSDTASLSTQIAKSLATFDDTIRVHGAQIVQEITKSADKVNQTTEQNFASLDGRLVSKSHEIAETLDTRIGRVEKTLDERTKSLNETLATRTLEFARTIADGAKGAQEAVDKSVAGMGEYFSTKAQEIA